MIEQQLEMLRSIDLTRFRSALFLQPHPDDNEVGAGGAIAKIAAAGVRVHYATVTDGSMGTYDGEITPEELVRIRRTEHEESGRLLGAAAFYWLGFADGGLSDSIPLREALVRLIRTVRPEILFTIDPWNPYEAHMDHIYTGQMAAYAALAAGFPHAFPKHRLEGLTPCAPDFVAFYATARPNHVEEIEPYWEMKKQAISLHRSQFQGEELSFVLGYLYEKGKMLGAEYGAALGEGFKILTPRMLHMNADAEKM